ncbi:MAG: (d)CMP kinase, partial [Planctomycetota bacterium]
TSQITANARGVREALVSQQREMGREGGVVMEGRDIGTVVFPGADLKLYFEVSVDERTRRRIKDFQDRGIAFDESSVREIQAAQVRDPAAEVRPAEVRPAEVRMKIYSDPIGRLPDPGAAVYRGEWLAAMAPVSDSDIGWVVIVQERRQAALSPIENVAARAKRQTWLSVLTTAIALMAIIWSFVWRAYSRSS